MNSWKKIPLYAKMFLILYGGDFMGNKCVICESDTTIVDRRKVANNEIVCQNCVKRAGTLTFKQMLKLKNVTSEEIKESIAKSSGEEFLKFKPDEKIGKIEFDYKSKKILIPGVFNQNSIINFSDIKTFELIEDGDSVTKGGIGRALVGGALFGGAGAVVGAITANKKKEYCDNLQVEITTSDKTTPAYHVPYISKRTKVKSGEYENAYIIASQLISTLQSVCDSEKETENIIIGEPEKSTVKKMKEYKELLDLGIITEEDFDEKKRETLGL